MTKYFFCDTETTGTDTQRSGLIQLAAIILYEEDGALVEKETIDFRAQPFESDIVDEAALLVNKTSAEIIKTYPEPQLTHKALLRTLKKYVDKYARNDKFLFCGYNARFDFEMLQNFFKKVGDKYFGSWFFFPPIDVMNLAIFHFRHERVSMPNFQLKTVAEHIHLQVEQESLHTALSDIRLTVELFKGLM